MKVTDLDYYMNEQLVVMMDKAISRQKKKWDNLWLYDGDEGAGKSTFAIAHCYYLANKTGATFTTNNIFFDLDKMMNFAAKNENQVILWDEAALGALSTQWMNKTQNKLVQALMTCRKKGHFWVFCIPKFYELRRYIVRRAMGLVHIYSPDGETRGYFTYYKKEKKTWLYEKVKRTLSESHYRSFDFRGRFIDYSNKPLIDWDAYEDDKDQAIIDMFANDRDTQGVMMDKMRIGITKCLEKYSIKELAKNFDVSVKTIYNWKDFAKKQGVEL